MTSLEQFTTNKVITRPTPEMGLEMEMGEPKFSFVTIGDHGSVIVWILAQFGEGEYQLGPLPLVNDYNSYPDDIKQLNFTCGAFAKNGTLVLGTECGKVCGYSLSLDRHNNLKAEFKKTSSGELYQPFMQQPVAQISCSAGKVVVCGARGKFYRYTPSISDGVYCEDLRTAATMQDIGTGVTALQMDEYFNREGMVGCTDGAVRLIQMDDKKPDDLNVSRDKSSSPKKTSKPKESGGSQKKEKKSSKDLPPRPEYNRSAEPITLVSKISPFIDEVNYLKHDANPNVFLTSVGKNSGEIKLYTAEKLDQIVAHSAKKVFGAVRFVASRDKRTRLLGFANGFIQVFDINSLAAKTTYQIEMKDRSTDDEQIVTEELTCASYSPSGNNFVIGTSFGAFLVGTFKKEQAVYQPRMKQDLVIARVEEVTHGTEVAVTSLQMTNFEPSGNILAAFSDGKVKCWTSKYKEEVYVKYANMINNSGKGKNRRARRQPIDIADYDEVQFDVVDTLDMFEYLEGEEDMDVTSADQIKSLFRVSPLGLAFASCQPLFTVSC